MSPAESRGCGYVVGRVGPAEPTRYRLAMSRENVELVRSAFAAFQAGDLDRLSDLVTEDLTVYRADPDGATAHGLDGFLELTMMVAVENVRSRFNSSLGLTSQGFTDRCEIPAPTP